MSVYDIAPSELIGTSIVELHHCLACYERADEFDVINDHSGLPAAALGGVVETPTLHTVHGPMDAIGGTVYEQIARVSPQVGLISISHEPADAEAGSPVGRELPERARPLALPGQAPPWRLPPLPRAHEPGQGLPPGDRRRRLGGTALEDRGEEARVGGGGLLRRVRAAAPLGQDRVPRRGHARREGRAAAERARDAVSDRVGRAVRPRHDRVHGVRDAGDRDAVRRRARGDRATAAAGSSSTTTATWSTRWRPPTRWSPSSFERYAEEHYSPERMVADYVAAYAEHIERVR